MSFAAFTMFTGGGLGTWATGRIILRGSLQPVDGLAGSLLPAAGLLDFWVVSVRLPSVETNGGRRAAQCPPQVLQEHQAAAAPPASSAAETARPPPAKGSEVALPQPKKAVAECLSKYARPVLRYVPLRNPSTVRMAHP